MTYGNARDARVTGGLYAASEVWSEAQPIPSKYAAINALTQGQHVIYALRLPDPDGIIKIGCCKDLARRAYRFHAEVLGFRPGDFDEEREIHRTLRPHVARGREFYYPTAAVLAVVNELREEFGLPHIAAA